MSRIVLVSHEALQPAWSGLKRKSAAASAMRSSLAARASRPDRTAAARCSTAWRVGPSSRRPAHAGRRPSLLPRCVDVSPKRGCRRPNAGTRACGSRLTRAPAAAAMVSLGSVRRRRNSPVKAESSRTMAPRSTSEVADGARCARQVPGCGYPAVAGALPRLPLRRVAAGTELPRDPMEDAGIETCLVQIAHRANQPRGDAA